MTCHGSTDAHYRAGSRGGCLATAGSCALYMTPTSSITWVKLLSIKLYFIEIVSLSEGLTDGPTVASCSAATDDFVKVDTVNLGNELVEPVIIAAAGCGCLICVHNVAGSVGNATLHNADFHIIIDAIFMAYVPIYRVLHFPSGITVKEIPLTPQQTLLSASANESVSWH